jgi:rhomboid protease GluP
VPGRRRVTELVEVRRSEGQREAEQLALVLAAVGIGCRLVAGRRGVGLCVAPRDAEAARRQLDAYERENAPEREPAMEARPGRHGLPAAIAYALVLLFFFGADRRGAWSIDWSAVGAAQAGLIRDGAWWRTLTALTLHADHAHLLGNLAAGVAFGTLAAQLLGPGLAWLAVLLAGALGNALDAAFHAPGHTAVGASTALFGALGVVSGHTWQRRKLPWRGGLRRWAPLAAGVMLLVYLGWGGERTDVGAHVAGFAAGAVLGLALGRHAGRLPEGPRAQRLYGLLACGLLSLAWLLALRGVVG